MLENTLKSVVKITMVSDQDVGVATGFSVYNDKLGAMILTNSHVCYDKDKAIYSIRDYSGNVSLVKWMRNDGISDLCLLRTTLQIKPLTLAFGAKRGQRVMMIGAPHGSYGWFNVGYIASSVNIDIGETHQRAFGVSLATYPGSSGSPIINENGEVVGIIFCGRRDSEMMGYAIPSEVIKRFLDNSCDSYEE